MQVKQTQKEDAVICAIIGEINIDTVDRLKTIFEKLTSAKSRKVIFNFEKLEYIDSAGFACLIRFSQDIKNIQGILSFSNLSPKIRSLFAITKLESIFKIYETEEEAIEDSYGY